MISARNQSAASARYKQRRRRLPPFGATVADITNLREVRVYCGSCAWRLRDNHRQLTKTSALLVCPPGRDPLSFRWPVRGNDTLIVGPTAADEIIDQLARAIS